MIKICTVYFEDDWSFYTPDYVDKFYNSLKRNTTIPFEFICLSDTDVKADLILPYNHHSVIKKHWHKLKFFSSQFANQKPDDDIIIMDIDQVITNNIDELINFPVSDNEFISYGTWWPQKIKVQGGFYKFKSGNFDYIWNDFALNPEYWQTHYYENGDVHYKYYGEQNYVNWKLYEKGIKVTHTPKEWLGKYSDNMVEQNKIYSKIFNTDYMILDDVNEMIKIVHFNGANNTIHKYNTRFIKENWR
tara:strand:+ start:439 stop:1176 length:738 start_codon:yes stop_codon:yes gene_type:complete